MSSIKKENMDPDKWCMADIEKCLANERELRKIIWLSSDKWADILNDLQLSEDILKSEDEWKIRYDNQKQYNMMLRKQIRRMKTEVHKLRHKKSTVPGGVSMDNTTTLECRQFCSELKSKLRSLKSTRLMYEHQLDAGAAEYIKLKEECRKIKKDVKFSHEARIEYMQRIDIESLNQWKASITNNNNWSKDSIKKDCETAHRNKEISDRRKQPVSWRRPYYRLDTKIGRQFRESNSYVDTYKLKKYIKGKLPPIKVVTEEKTKASDTNEKKKGKKRVRFGPVEEFETKSDVSSISSEENDEDVNACMIKNSRQRVETISQSNDTQKKPISEMNASEEKQIRTNSHTDNDETDVDGSGTLNLDVVTWAKPFPFNTQLPEFSSKSLQIISTRKLQDIPKLKRRAHSSPTISHTSSANSFASSNSDSLGKCASGTTQETFISHASTQNMGRNVSSISQMGLFTNKIMFVDLDEGKEGVQIEIRDKSNTSITVNPQQPKSVSEKDTITERNSMHQLSSTNGSGKLLTQKRSRELIRQKSNESRNLVNSAKVYPGYGTMTRRYSQTRPETLLPVEISDKINCSGARISKAKLSQIVSKQSGYSNSNICQNPSSAQTSGKCGYSAARVKQTKLSPIAKGAKNTHSKAENSTNKLSNYNYVYSMDRT